MNRNLKIEIGNEKSGKNENRLGELKYAIRNNDRASKDFKLLS